MLLKAATGGPQVLNNVFKKVRGFQYGKENNTTGCCPRILCGDGFTVSIQVGSGNYCTPRKNGANEYTEVEVGFPSEWCEELAPYKEPAYNPDVEPHQTESVFPYTPIGVVCELLNRHGGIVGAVLHGLEE